MPQIEVAFDIDANGILKVTAKDKGTGKEQNIVIKNATNLSEDEVERMKAEAEKHAEEDKQKKERVEARNQASQVVFELEKQLKEHGDKVSEEERKQIEEQVAKLKELSDKEEASTEDLKKATETTLASAQKLGEAVYKAQAEAAKPAAEEAPAPEGDAPKGNGVKEEAKKKAEEGEVVE
jgi:molecular chaperone DnaK